MLPLLTNQRYLRTQQQYDSEDKNLQIQQFRLFKQKNKTIEPKKTFNKEKQLFLKQESKSQSRVIQFNTISLSINRYSMKQKSIQRPNLLPKNQQKNKIKDNKNNRKKTQMQKSQQNRLRKSKFQTINLSCQLNIRPPIKNNEIHTLFPLQNQEKRMLSCTKDKSAKYKAHKFKRNTKFQRYLQQNQQTQNIVQSFSFGRYQENLKNQQGEQQNSLSYNRRMHLKKIKDFLCNKVQQRNQFLSNTKQQNCCSQEQQKCQKCLNLQQNYNQNRRFKLEKSKIKVLKDKIYKITSHKQFSINKHIKLLKPIGNQSFNELHNKCLQIDCKQVRIQNQWQPLKQKFNISNNQQVKNNSIQPNNCSQFKNQQKQNIQTKNKLRQSKKNDKEKLKDLIFIDVNQSINLQKNRKKILIKSKQNLIRSSERYRLGQEQVNAANQQINTKRQHYDSKKRKRIRIDEFGTTFEDKFRKHMVPKDQHYISKCINKFKL